MNFKYSRSPSRDPAFPYFLHPLVSIRLYRGQASVPLIGLIDSGADYTVFDYRIAKQLYIDWKTGKQSQISGIDGKPTISYLHDLEIEIVGLANGKVKSTVAFAELKGVGVLLGQYGFFEHFKVSFDAQNETFSIDL